MPLWTLAFANDLVDNLSIVALKRILCLWHTLYSDAYFIGGNTSDYSMTFQTKKPTLLRAILQIL